MADFIISSYLVILISMRVPKRRSEAKAYIKIDPHITREKYEELKSKLEHLKKVTRLRLMQEVATLAEGGDFSENAGYQIAKGRLRGVNQTILELEERLKKAVIIEKGSASLIVVVGSEVTLEVNGDTRKYTILGSSETDPIRGIISHNSPLGSALLGKAVGGKVTITHQGVPATAVITAIE